MFSICFPYFLRDATYWHSKRFVLELTKNVRGKTELIEAIIQDYEVLKVDPDISSRDGDFYGDLD